MHTHPIGQNVMGGILNSEEKKLTSPEIPTSSFGKVQIVLEFYRVTVGFISKLVLPAVLCFAILFFRETIDSLISRTTEAEVAGAKLRFSELSAAKLDEAVESQSPEKVAEVVDEIRSSAILESFVTDEKGNPNKKNLDILREWMTKNGIKKQALLIDFILQPFFARDRAKAIIDLGLVK